MKIKKLGHCCLVVNINGVKIMTDPGSYTITEQEAEKNINIILITHEHQDHLHVDSLKNVLVNNPNAIIITNTGVGKILDEAGVKYEILDGINSKDYFGVNIEAHDCKHEEIFEEIGQVQNTGYFIGQRLFYPGDSLYNPPKSVEILALSVAGPWVKVKDFMKYALEVKPKICFPVHDGALQGSFGSAHRVPSLVLPKFNITFKTLEREEEF